VRDRWRRFLTRELARLRREGRGALLWSLRITVAATSAYVVAVLLFPETLPLLAPLTAMLVVQVTPVSLLASGIERVVAVVAGVSVAVVFASVVPLEWWSLGLLIFVSITIGQGLRLQSNLVEVAISGMLVLSVGSLGAGAAAWQRITETLLGAAVGIGSNLLFPPKVASGDAGRAIDGLADSISDLLERVAAELTELAPTDRPGIAAAAREWLDEARGITHDIPQIGALLLEAEEGRRLNVRAVGTAHVEPGLRQGLEALEHSAVSIRGMLRAVADATYDAGWLDDEAAEDLLLGLAQTFRELAAGIGAFGELVRTEADSTKRFNAADEQDLRDALDGLHEARARLEELVATGAGGDLLEMHAAVLATVKRLMTELDLDERVRRQVRLVRRPRPRVRQSGGPPPVAAPEPDPDAETQRMPRLRADRREPPWR
jgi:Fusaric acid resistance protein-like